MQFVRNFVKRMNSSTVSWKDTHLPVVKMLKMPEPLHSSYKFHSCPQPLAVVLSTVRPCAKMFFDLSQSPENLGKYSKIDEINSNPKSNGTRWLEVSLV